MSMRVNTIITHLRAEDAFTLIEFLDQLRDVLARTYGPDMTAMMQQVKAQQEAAQAEDADVQF
jgi:membrane peptidoglycan carboxypeptidase